MLCLFDDKINNTVNVLFVVCNNYAFFWFIFSLISAFIWLRCPWTQLKYGYILSMITHNIVPIKYNICANFKSDIDQYSNTLVSKFSNISHVTISILQLSLLIRFPFSWFVILSFIYISPFQCICWCIKPVCVGKTFDVINIL